MNNNVTDKVSEVKEKLSELSDKFSALEGFRRQWVIVSIVLFVLLFLLLLIGKAPWCDDCHADDPELTNRIALLEEENTQIVGLKSDVEELTVSKEASKEEFASLQVYVKNLQRGNATIVILKNRIKELEKISENAKTKIAEFEEASTGFESSAEDLKKSKALLADLKANIKTLKRDNATIVVLKKRIKELEKITKKGEAEIAKFQEKSVNAEELADLKTNIKTLKRENATIVVLKNRIKELEKKTKKDEAKIAEIQEKSTSSEEVIVLKERIKELEKIEKSASAIDEKSTSLMERVTELEKENSIIETLQAKIQMLETTEASLQDPADADVDAELLAKIEKLEEENSSIPYLKAKIDALENKNINPVKTEEVLTTFNATKIYFEPGSSRIPAASSSLIADIIAYLQKNETAKVELLSFHDSVGNARWNIHLATKRSDRLKQLLIDSDVSLDRIIVGQPAHVPNASQSEDARRVEVKLITE